MRLLSCEIGQSVVDEGLVRDAEAPLFLSNLLLLVTSSLHKLIGTLQQFHFLNSFVVEWGLASCLINLLFGSILLVVIVHFNVILGFDGII